jgi:hypothetical protein
MTSMPPKEFRDVVERYAGREQDDVFVRAAVEEEAEEHGALRQERVQAVANRAQEMARGVVSVPKDKDDGGRTGRELGLSAEAAVIGNVLAKRLEPWARELRKLCFDSFEPPFQEWGEALKWIREEVVSDREKWRATETPGRNIEAEIQRLADLAGLEVKIEPRWLRYYEPDNEYTQLAPAFPDTDIEKLAKELNRVSRETAFHPVVLAAFVLCGSAPEISRIRITETAKTCRISGDRIPSRWVTIRFNAADVTDVELRTIYKDVRTFFGAVNKARITWSEAQFLFLVDSMGGWPSDDKTRFWEAILRQWKVHRASQYLSLNSWQAVRNKYERLTKRTSLRELVTPNPPTPPMSKAELEKLARRYPPQEN